MGFNVITSFHPSFDIALSVNNVLNIISCATSTSLYNVNTMEEYTWRHNTKEREEKTAPEERHHQEKWKKTKENVHVLGNDMQCDAMKWTGSNCGTFHKEMAPFEI